MSNRAVTVKVLGKRSKRTPVTTLTIPIRDSVSINEGIECGLRTNMFEIGEKEPEWGGMDTGSGLGSDAIQMHWRGRHAIISGRALFKAWVATFAPEDAKRMP